MSISQWAIIKIFIKCSEKWDKIVSRKLILKLPSIYLHIIVAYIMDQTWIEPVYWNNKYLYAKRNQKIRKKWYQTWWYIAAKCLMMHGNMLHLENKILFPWQISYFTLLVIRKLFLIQDGILGNLSFINIYKKIFPPASPFLSYFHCIKLYVVFYSFHRQKNFCLIFWKFCVFSCVSSCLLWWFWCIKYFIAEKKI